MCASAAHVQMMPSETTEKKSHRLVARVSRAEKKLFQQAANLEGRTLAGFLLAHAREAAQKAVTQHQTIRLNSQQSREFVESLLAPPRAPTTAMKRALKRYGRAVTEA
jgi:uncharacterized protein (DUF1778 family)